jgi:predicted Zn finger-like uncharacterized protein
MQANCPQCTQRIVIDDARVPDRAFSVKCPKCQNTVKFPGRAAVAAASPAPAGASTTPAVPPPPDMPPPALESGAFEAPPSSGMPGSDEMRTQLMAQLRREMSMGTGADAGTSGRALVAFPDRAVAGAVTVMLSRQGYVVDTIEDWDEASRLIEQGLYSLTLTTRAPAPAGKDNLYQRLARLSPDNRRRIFVVLVGDEWKSGDALQAFTASADLVLNTREAAAADALLRNIVTERARLYQVYNDARVRHEASV